MPQPGAFRRFLAAAVLAAGATGMAACGTGVSTSGTSPTGTAQSSTVQSGTVQSGQASGAASGAGAAGIPVKAATPEAAEVLSPPVRIQVEGTGIDLEVVPVGAEDNGAMTIPDNHYQAGWYRYGPGPGSSSGSAVLAAHVDSRTERLPIAGLDDVTPGTPVLVTLEDGSVLEYRTETVENTAKRSLDGHRLFDRTGDHRLKLVTCGGKWLDTEGDYEDNVVLTAAPLS